MPFTTISGGGAFTKQNIAAINGNFSLIVPTVDLWVRPQYGNNTTGTGTYDYPLASLAGTSKYLKPGMVIGVRGVLFEEFATPIVNDITVLGFGGTVPRQATTSGVPNGGGATWLSPSGGAGILATVKGQGWTFANLYFNNSAAQPDVQLLRSGTGDVPADPDGSHAAFLNCRFTGADAGIQASGGIAGVYVDGCQFFNFTGSGDCAIETVTGAGIGTNLGWTLSNNFFFNNDNHVIAALSQGRVVGNDFCIVGASVTATRALKIDGGTGSSSVYQNSFNRPLNSSPNATLYVGGTNDTWTQNFGTDGAFYGVPDNS